MTRLQAIRKFCVHCMGGSTHLPRDCPSTQCHLYQYRMGTGGGPKVQVIRRYCLECCGGSTSEVQKCTDTYCPLYPFRMGLIHGRVNSKNIPVGEFSTPYSTKQPALIVR